MRGARRWLAGLSAFALLCAAARFADADVPVSQSGSAVTPTAVQTATAPATAPAPAPLPAQLIEQLSGSDAALRTLALQAVEAVRADAAATMPGFDDALFSAARVAQDDAADPARALVLYQRIVEEFPSGRLAKAAERHAVQLKALVGSDPSSAGFARTLAQLRAASDARPYAEIVAGVEPLIDAAWIGAPEAALWLGEYERRIGELAAAQRHLERVVRQWPQSVAAPVATRELAAVALDRRQWQVALQWAAQIDATDPADAALRAGIETQAQRGLRFATWYGRAWAIAVLVIVVLSAAFAFSVWRSANRRRAMLPPLEFWFLLPIAGLLYGVSLTANIAIGPAVLLVSSFGLLIAWLVGGTLQARSVAKLRLGWFAVLLAGTAALGVVAVLYIALMRQGLLFDMLETLRFGPEL